MSSKRFLICIVVSILIFALFGLTACEEPSPDIGGGDVEVQKVSIAGGASTVNNTIQTARATNGILISYTITSKEDGREQSSTVTFGANGDKYYYLIDGEEIIYDLSGSTGMDMYTKTTSDTLWTKSSMPYTEMSKQQATAIMNESYTTFATYMTSYSLYSAEGSVFVKAGTEQIAGHNCTKYKYTVSLLGMSSSTIYWVEESTGICFKVGYEGNAYDAAATVSIVLTQYQETFTVNIPTQSQIANGSECNHVDLDNDDYCDICNQPYDSSEVTCNHIDDNGDNYCDVCNEYYVSPAPGTITLHTPVVEVDADNGLASWDAISNATGYICKVNGVDKAKQTATTIQLNDGDTLKVKAVGDGNNKKDSEWSSQTEYDAKPQYDFSNLGLSSYNESILITYLEAEAGYYPDSDIYKCSNGDLISYRGESYIDIYSLTNGYTKLTLIDDYFTSDTTTDYELINYVDNKYAYYAELSVSAVGLTLYNNRTTPVYANYQAFIDASGYEILDYNEYKTDDYNAYELLNYTEHSGDFDGNYLNTKYMHPSRSFSYLDDYSAKISSWTVERVNQEGKNYSDSTITIQFSADFNEGDYLALLTYLRDQYALAADEGSHFAPSGYGVNIFEGEINVYDFPYEEEGDSLADRYKLIGGVDMPYTLIVQYTYLTWFDGGTFATYVTTPDGLFRIVDGKIQLMIAPDGTVQEYILAPYKTLTNFEVTYTLDAEGDAESRAEGYFVDTYTFKKVGDYILFTTTKEDYIEYTVYRIEGEMLYLRCGSTNSDGDIEWNDFDYYSDKYYKVLDVYNEIIGKYFTNQIKCTQTGSTTCAGEPCSIYSYDDEYYTYTYYANTEGITLRYVEEASDGGMYTKELTGYNDNVSSFTAQEQGIIDDSGISNYNGEQ